MVADASIYSMIRQPQAGPGPLEQYAQGQTVRNLMQAGQLQDVQLQQAQKGIADEEQVAAAYRESGGDPIKLRDLLYGKGLYKQATAADKAGLERKVQEADLKHKGAQTEKLTAETLSANTKMLRDQLATVRDDAGLSRLRDDTMRIFGMKAASGIPMSVNDPNFTAWQSDQLMTADELLKRLKPELKMTDIGGKVIPVNPYTGAQQGGGIAKTAAPMNPVWDSERGTFINPPSLGGPVAGGVSPQPAGAAPASGGPAAPVSAPAPALPPRASDITNLRKEFNDLPEVKNYRSVVPIFNSAIKAPDTRAGDIQFAYTIGKIFDPNSVVREGELKLVGDAATVLERFQGELRTLTEGKGRLTPATRRELLQTAEARVKELEAAQAAARATYETQAKAKNMPLDQIFIEMPKLEKLPNTTSGRIGGLPTRSDIDAELRRRGVIK